MRLGWDEVSRTPNRCIIHAARTGQRSRWRKRVDDCTTLQNRYRLDAELGHGGMGTVYRATDTQTGELVAVKALNPQVMARDPAMLERFVREGEALGQLNHPNIVRMIAAVQEQGQ
jgi:serine/threonine protein kinase